MNKKIKPIAIVLGCIVLLSVFISGCIKPTEYMFEMRDGVHLATDVYLPGGQNQPHGTILITSRHDHAVFGFCSIDTSAERCL